MRNFISHEFGTLERITNEDGKRVYNTPTGKKYPSVTTVTGLYKMAQIMEWRKRVGEEVANKISSEASGRGTRIHELCEYYLKGQELEINYRDTDMFESIKPYLDKIDNIHALETPLYSDHLEVAGTVDCIAEYDGRLSIIDFKTSRRWKSADDIHDYFMQTACYAVAFEERTKLPVTQLVIIMAVDNNDPLIFKEHRDKWIGGFIELRDKYRRKNGF
jgi:hypothetical protein